MSPKKKRLKAKQVVKILQANGFVVVDQEGSHVKLFNPGTRKQTIVPYHQGKDLKIGLLCAIEKQSGVNFL
jgi:predicted RNA binding protein YcfA (HicA-like mRNA interferase family)